MNIGDAAVTAVFGYAVVFFGLILLMVVICCVGLFFKSKEKSTTPVKNADITENAPEKPVEEEDKPVAKGSAGHVKIYDVPDKEAAMIMAIVADTMKKPLNELHFISIKEVK